MTLEEVRLKDAQACARRQELKNTAIATAIWVGGSWSATLMAFLLLQPEMVLSEELAIGGITGIAAGAMALLSRIGKAD